MGRGYSMIVSTVADVRSEPKFKSERIHQLVFGEVVEVLEETDNDYLLVCDVRINYKGYAKKNQLLTIDIQEYNRLLLSNKVIKVKVPFCRTSGALEYMLPVGSRLIVDGDIFVLPNGRHFRLLDDPLPDTHDIVEFSKKFLGVPYLWGGTSTYGFDCSGFTNRMYDVFDMDLPRDASQQEEFCEAVGDPVPGDLLFLPGHVMMYIGDNKVIHANGHNMCVEITDLLRDEYGRFLSSRITKVGRAKKKGRSVLTDNK